MNNRIVLIQKDAREVVVSQIPKIEFVFHGENNIIRVHETFNVEKHLKIVLGSNCTINLEEGANCVSSYIDINADNINLNIGKKVCFNNLQLFAAGEPNLSICIGDRTIFAINVVIRANDRHTIYDLTTRTPINKPKSGVHIGTHVWIGQDVFIMKDAHIPDNCVVGARSLVTGAAKLEQNSVIAGIPAKSIRSNVNWDIRTIDQYEKESRSINDPVIGCKNSQTITKIDLKASREYSIKEYIQAIKSFSCNAAILKTKNTRFETLYVPYEKKPHRTLYVFLSAGGRSKKDTLFNCWSWTRELDGDLLCIEDPTYKKLITNSNRTLTGWYFGDERNSYLIEIANIIDSIRNELSYREIIFAGTSAGGYAALFLADRISGSIAIAGNPQINISEWNQYRYYPEIHKYKDSDAFGRFDISRITKNAKSKFLILYNYFNNEDRDQVSHLSTDIQPGFKRLNNVLLLGLNSFFRPGHNVIYSKDDFPNLVFLCRIFNSNSSYDIDYAVRNLSKHLIDAIQSRYNYLYKNDIEVISRRVFNRLISNNIIDVSLNNTNDHINIYFTEFGIKYRFDFSIEHLISQNCVFGFHVQTDVLNERLQREICNFASKYNMNADKNNFVLKVSIVEKGYDLAVERFCNFIIKTHGELKDIVYSYR